MREPISIDSFINAPTPVSEESTIFNERILFGASAPSFGEETAVTNPDALRLIQRRRSNGITSSSSCESSTSFSVGCVDMVGSLLSMRPCKMQNMKDLP